MSNLKFRLQSSLHLYCALYLSFHIALVRSAEQLQEREDMLSLNKNILQNLNSVENTNTFELVNNFSSENGENNKFLRERGTDIPALDDRKNRDAGSEEPPKGLPRPIMYRWFPQHSGPPTDHPDEFGDLPEMELMSFENEKYKMVANLSKMGAVFHDPLLTELEEAIEIEEEREDEDPLEAPKKSTRVRRDLSSWRQVRRQNLEIMRQRKAIIANERRLRFSTTPKPRQRTTRKPPVKRTYRRPSSTRGPTTKKPWSNKPKLTGKKKVQTSTKRSKKSNVPRPTSQNARGLSSTAAAPNTGKSTQNPTRNIVSNSTTSTASTRNSSSVEETTSANAQRVAKTTTAVPKSQPTRSTSKGTKATKTSSSTTKQKGSSWQRMQNTSKPKVNMKSSGAVFVVKPVILQNGRKVTKTITRPIRPKVYDSPLPRNRRTRLTFSKWGQWMSCKAKSCGAMGRQMRTRTCYGNNLTPADYAVCNYNSLVDHRPCRAKPCTTRGIATTTATPSSRISRWSEWSKCSVTCGINGEQTRTKICYDLSPANDGEEEEMVAVKCEGKTFESRPCQYSVSCPMWVQWSSWSSCSKTCGMDGVSFRERKCIVERYVSFDMKGRNGPQRPNGNRQFDSGPGRRSPVLQENTTNKTVVLKPPPGSVVKPKKASSYNGKLYLNDKGREVFIVDAPRETMDEEQAVQRPTFHERRPVKEFVDAGLCSENGEISEEERRCVQERCPAEWGEWSTWSRCETTCGTGISRRERKCSGEKYSSPCTGRKYTYRRCYAPPCWAPWSAFSRCSITCGDKPGVKKRRRECKGTSTVVPEYTFCEGKEVDTIECETEPCSDSSWSKWSEYEECSASCNGGYRRRTRTCLDEPCEGPSEDFGRCNIQECPAWSKWSMYSCCSVTCGKGTRRRKRTCTNGQVGPDACVTDGPRLIDVIHQGQILNKRYFVPVVQRCTGKTSDIESCYKEPCGGKPNKPSVFTGIKCGVGSVSNLKKIAILRIFGGARSAAHDWPWQVSWQHRETVESDWQHFCGATLIHPRWVITASHCTEESEYIVNHKNPGETWAVVIGMVKLYKDGTRYFVDRIFVHPKYEYKSVTKNDIALLKLRKMVPVTKDVMPACMPRSTRPSVGESCYVTGWGYTNPRPDALLSLSLREASVPIMQFSRCRTLGDYYRYFLDPTMHMCAGNPVTASADSCTGDSGGPLVCTKNKRWYLAAVTSFGFADCGTPGHVGIYAPMSTYERWVRNIVEENTYEKC